MAVDGEKVVGDVEDDYFLTQTCRTLNSLTKKFFKLTQIQNKIILKICTAKQIERSLSVRRAFTTFINKVGSWAGLHHWCVCC